MKIVNMRLLPLRYLRDTDIGYNEFAMTYEVWADLVTDQDELICTASLKSLEREVSKRLTEDRLYTPKEIINETIH